MQSRPRQLKGKTYKRETPSGTAYITINDREGQPFEVFVRVGKAGATLYALAEALGRMTSLALRRNTPVDEVYEQLRGISTDSRRGDLLSLPDVVAKTLKEHADDRAS